MNCMVAYTSFKDCGTTIWSEAPYLYSKETQF